MVCLAFLLTILQKPSEEKFKEKNVCALANKLLGHMEKILHHKKESYEIFILEKLRCVLKEYKRCI